MLQLVSPVHPIVPILNSLPGLLIHLDALQLHYKYYLVRMALRLMGVAASALDTGQFSLASFASFWKVSSSMPGTTASVSRSIGLMAKPPGTGLKCTRAVVCTLVGVKPALASALDSAIE